MKQLIFLCLVALLGLCASSTANRRHMPEVPVQERISWNVTLTAQTSPQPANSPNSKESSCGKRNAAPGLFLGRIAGGNTATPNEYPWQAYLQIYLSTGVIYACGGTLINNQWILTSANCVNKAISINVYLGIHDLNANELQRVVYTSTVYIKHPRWNEQSPLDADLALIKLPIAINFNSYIKSICLPSPDDYSHEGDTVTLTGWGRTSGYGDGPMSFVLKETTTTVISNTECKASYISNAVTDDVICSSGSGGRGICEGDYGGPMAYIEADGTFVQIGVASFYSSSGCEFGLPSGFTRLKNYVNWISEQTGTPVRNSAVPVIDSTFYKLLLATVFVVQCFTY